jgi:hypothetical protein
MNDEYYIKPTDLNDEENGGVAVLTGERVSIHFKGSN